MAIRSGFFNSVNGDRKYDASKFAEYFASFIGNGVFPNPSTGLQVTANNDMTITVKAGKAWINGYIIINDDDYIFQLEPADGVLSRIDRIVARYDTVDREIRLEVKKGTFASSPVAPSLQRDADAYELGIADIYIGKGVISITQANITDLRLNNEVCGVVHGLVDQVDTTTIFNQYQAWFNDITSGTEQEIADWQQQQYDDFMIWFQSIQDILEGDVAANLASRISSLENDFTSHKAEKATQEEFGHVKGDEETIFSVNGVLTTTNPYIDDLTGSPGSPYLLSGTMEEGFFGEVSSSELITGDSLASQVGISQGTSQHSTAGWLKFAYKGKIQFIAKNPIRSSISWDAINTAKCVYGDSGDKQIIVDGKTYKVRLMRALDPSINPKATASAYSGTVNHGSEWNRLMCQIHEQAIGGSWDYPDNIENDIGILEHSLGNGTNGMYNDADLVVKSGDGRASWCQEMSTSTSHRLYRGYNGVSLSSGSTSSNAYAYDGWRPVLELVP